MNSEKKNIKIFDMQPIHPPIGGGRIRLLGLYHNLGSIFESHYIGSYDWEGENYRDHYVSSSLRETDIPLSEKHFNECKNLQERVNGKTIIDTTFPLFAHHSEKYYEYIREQVLEASIIVFSHPWVFPLVKDLIDVQKQIVVYDSHNVEGYLRFSLLNDGGLGTEIVREVVKTEYELCQFADVILTCSFDDNDLFNKIYKIPYHKMKVVPNGVFTEKILPVFENEKTKIKQKLNLENTRSAIFIGSNYAPNIEACNFILQELAPNLPDITFILAGGVGGNLNKNLLKKSNNVRLTGFISEEEKLEYLSASEIAINPMFSGSGTNIKMFDFMAAGLPVVSTNFGARGITKINHAGLLIENDKDGFIKSINELFQSPKKRSILGKKNREIVEKNYSYEKISPALGDFFIRKFYNKFNDKPFRFKSFSIMSSWNLRCGIAEHTRYLVNEFEKLDLSFRIIANSNGDVTSSELIEDISRSVDLLWKYDYEEWINSSIDVSGIIQMMHSNQISKLIIQYHTGFFKTELLKSIVKQCKEENFEIIITLHNRKEMDLDTLMFLNYLDVKFIVHSLIDKKFLNENGIFNTHLIPLGIHEYPDEDKEKIRKTYDINGSPVIGSFGFLREHKGLSELIQAISLLKTDFPNIKLLGINSLYPSKDSEEYYEVCQDLIDKLKLHDNVTLVTDYLEINEIIQYLHATDLIVLPYHNNNEGASASANTVISSKRPFLISSSEIFNEIHEISHIMKDIHPSTIAQEINKFISNPSDLEKMKKKLINFVDKNSYSAVAGKYLEMIYGVNNGL